jgi:hypothetical protein
VKGEPAGVSDGGNVRYERTLDFACGTLPGASKPIADHHAALWELLELQASDHDYHLVYESFDFRNAEVDENNKKRDKVELVSREYIGVIKLFQQTWTSPEHPKIHKYTASQAKSFIEDWKLQRLGLFQPLHVDRHAMDAMRHLILYMVDQLKIHHGIVDQWKI